MLSENDLRQLSEKALSMCDGCEGEVVVSSGESALTRFGESVITQNVASKSLGMSMRLMKDGRTGKASTGNLSGDGIQRCVATARAALDVAAKDPDLPPPLEPQSYQPIKAYHQTTLDLTPEDRATGVGGVVKQFSKDNLEAAGIYSNGGSVLALANTRGLWAAHRWTDATFSISAMSDDSSGWAEESDPDSNRVSVPQLASVAAQKALTGRKPGAIEPGAYTVVFEPAAVADFLLFLSWEAFNGLAYAEGRSCFSGKVGQKVLGDNITIVDDAYHPMTLGMPFDMEGAVRQRVTLVENGVFRGVVHDRRTARLAGVETTGHAFPQPDPWGPSPLNIVMSPGDSSLDEMVASTDRGVLVSRLHYTNILDPMKMTLTGMTRDGLFLIEKGKVTKGLKNMRFTDSALRVLSNVELMSRELYKTRTFWGSGASVAPAVKVNGFVFSSATEN